MSTLRSCRPIAVVLLIVLWPALGLAQSAPPAGVVTGLQGRATVARPVVAQPIPLKFRDDVFLRDQVETKENSLVRVLLGGKALVTIRELSTFSITEQPGQAAVDLRSGKLAVGVAKSLLRPGEAIEIRTPNAIAAVRGSLLVASVTISGGVPQSVFTALDASLPIIVTPLAGGGAQVPLQANQAVGVSGIGANTVMGPVQNVTPDVARREAQTASAPRAADPQSASSPMAADISTARVQEATALAALIAGPPPTTTTTQTTPAQEPAPSDSTLTSATQTQLLQESGSTITVASQTAVQSTPPPPSTSTIGVNASETGQAVVAEETSTPVPPVPPVPPAPPVPPVPIVPPVPPVVPVPPPAGPVVISGQILTLAADQTLKTFTGESSSTDPGAAVAVTNSTVTGADNLVVVEPGASASLAGPLLHVSGTGGTVSSLAANSSVVDISGALSSSTTAAFISIDPTVISTADFLRIVGGSLTLAGPLLTDVQGIYATSGDFLSVQQGGTLTGSSTSPLLQFSGSIVTLGGATSTAPSHLLTLGGDGSSLTLGGSLAGLAGASIIALNGAAGSSLLGIGPGTALMSPSTSSVLDLSGSVLSLGTGVSGLLATGGTVNVGGSLLRAAAGSAIAADVAVPLVDLSNTTVKIAGSLVRLEGGSALQSGGVKLTGGSLTASTLLSTDGAANVATVGGPVLDLSNATVTLQALSAHDLPGVDTDTVTVQLAANQPELRLSSSTLSLGKVDGLAVGFGDAAGLFPTIPGVALIAGGTLAAPSTVNLGGGLLGIQGGAFTATQPLVQLDHTTVNQTSATSDLLAALIPPGLTTTMAGPLLRATDSTITTAGRLFHFMGGSLTSSTTAPFLFFDPSTVTSGRQIVVLDQGSGLSLSGPLFAATSTTFKVGDPTLAASFVNVFDGASVTSTSTAPLLSFDASSVDTSGSLLSVRRSASLTLPSRLTLAGPLFSAINGSSFNTTSQAFGPTFGVAGSACCSVFSLQQGAQLTSTTTVPLIQMVGSSINAGPDAQSGGSIFVASDTSAGFPATELVAPASVSLAGPVLSANGSTISALFNLLAVARSSFASTTTDPLIQLTGSTVGVGGVDPFTGANSSSRVVVVSGSATTSASLSLRGPLMSAVDSSITSGQEILGVFNGASLTDTGLGALLSFSGGSATAGTAVATGTGGNFFSFASSLGLPVSVSLAGPLINASNTTLKAGDPSTRTATFLFVGDSAKLASTGTGPFLSFENTSVDSGGNMLTLRRPLAVDNPTRLTLAGPLFLATNGSNFNTTTLGFGSACCSGFFVGQAVELTSTGTAALIQLANSTFNAGPDVQSGGSFFHLTDGTACCTDVPLLVAPAKMTLAGPLLNATNSSVSALFDLLGVIRSDLSSSGGEALIQLSSSAVNLGGTDPFTNTTTGARLLSLVSSAASETVGSPASVSLAGPLLLATNSNATMSLDLIGIFNGATFSTSTTKPLVQLDGGSLTTGVLSGVGGSLLDVLGRGGATGAEFATASFGGPLLTATNSNLTLGGSLINVPFNGGLAGGQITATGSTDPLVLVTGGSLQQSGATPAGWPLFRMFGRTAATAVDPQTGLTLGTDRPLQGPLQLDGTRPVLTSLLETSGATVQAQKIAGFDTMLLEATAPLLSAKAGSQITTAANAVDLLQRANIITSLGADVIRLDASTLSVANGALVNLAGGSKLTVSGNLASLLNGATLSVLNGPLIMVSGGSFANITGGLISFGGTGGNTVNITNSLCAGGCATIGGVPVALQGGALATNVQITSPIKNPALGTVNLSPNAALAVVNGPTSKLIVGPR